MKVTIIHDIFKIEKKFETIAYIPRIGDAIAFFHTPSNS